MVQTVRNAFRGCFLILQASRVISKTRATFKSVLTGGYLMLTARGTSKTEKLSIEEILRFLVWLLRKLFTLVWVMFFFTKQTCFGIFLLILLLGTWWGVPFFALSLGSHILAWIRYMGSEGNGLLASW